MTVQPGTIQSAAAAPSPLADKPLARPGAIGEGHRRRRVILWMTAGALAVFFGWAANAPLEETTRGTGKVVPSSRGQIIQSLEGGILQSLEVNEGDEVTAGQTLAVIDDTRFRAEYEELASQTVALRAMLDRLMAEYNNDETVAFHPSLVDNEEVKRVERQLFEARRRRFTGSVAALNERLALARRELELVQPMVKLGAASALEEIRLLRTVADIESELAEVKNTYYQEISQAIAEKGAELTQLKQRLAQKRDVLARTALKSPVRGIVKDMEVTTRGGVVSPGQTIMEIVPLEDQLYVEARIRPQDVAFLHAGQKATVRITAYDYTIYGSLEGELVFISADTIREERQPESEPYYRVRVLTDQAHLEGPDGPLPIKPGMMAEVGIQTGSKTVLEYLMKPLLRGQEAFHER